MRRMVRLVAGALALVVCGAVLPGCGQVQGKDEVGWFRQSDASFHNRLPDGASQAFLFGEAGGTDNYPIAGDWDGDGKAHVGWFRQGDASWHIQQPDGTSNPFLFGEAGGTDNYPFAGDWNGDGKDQVGWFRQGDSSFHLRAANGTSQAFAYGDPGRTDVYPVAGDWDGDGRDEVGYYRQSDASWHLRKADGTSENFVFGDNARTDVYPVAGDWDGDGKDQVGWLRVGDASYHLRQNDGTSQNFVYGNPGGTQIYPIAGNWDGDTPPPPPAPAAVTITDIENIYGPLGASRDTVIQGLPSLNEAMLAADITTPARKAAFLATIRNESGFRFNALQGGGTYQGRGFIQLTGDFNYGPAGQWLGIDLLGHPELAADIRYSARIARWYWTVARVINPMADALDMGAVDDAIGYANSPAEDAERCADFKAALRYYNGGTLPAGINCVRPALAAGADVYPADQPKGIGVGD